jgi:hypothetical protein
MSGGPFTEPELELGRLFTEGRLPPYPRSWAASS